jgi:hypothetical protein
MREEGTGLLVELCVLELLDELLLFLLHASELFLFLQSHPLFVEDFLLHGGADLFLAQLLRRGTGVAYDLTLLALQGFTLLLLDFLALPVLLQELLLLDLFLFLPRVLERWQPGLTVRSCRVMLALYWFMFFFLSLLSSIRDFICVLAALFTSIRFCSSSSFDLSLYGGAISFQSTSSLLRWSSALRWRIFMISSARFLVSSIFFQAFADDWPRVPSAPRS